MAKARQRQKWRRDKGDGEGVKQRYPYHRSGAISFRSVESVIQHHKDVLSIVGQSSIACHGRCQLYSRTYAR